MEVISSCISESELWSNFKVFTLSENMRLTKPNISADERSLISSFASWLLDIGDGKTGEPDPQDPENTSWVDIPINYCIPDNENGLQNLINFIYDQSTLQTPSAVTLQQKAIVCPKNETADTINSKVLEMVQGETKIYLSHDEATPIDNDGAETEMLYPVEHLNTLKLSGFPPHRLELKVGAPVMLLRNVNVAGGLCNGTRMIVKQIMTKLIEVQIITGTRVGEKVFIHRISLIHKDPNLPFVLKRRQFPIKLCYAMTINKSQGQSLSKIGVFLPGPIFGHGQYMSLFQGPPPPMG
ncbi:DNA helicase [Tanacetum coccineum]